MSIFKRKSKFEKDRSEFQKKDSYEEDIYRRYGGYGYWGYSYWETERSIGWDLKNGYTKSTRIDAAEKLGRMKTDEALDELIDAIGEKDEDVRAAIMKAIENIGIDRAVERLLKRAIGTIDNKEKINQLVEKLKKGSNDEKRMLLLAMKFDGKLKEEVGKNVDNDLAKSLWSLGEEAFPLIAEISRDENKRKMLLEELASSNEEIISKAIVADEEEVSDMAIELIGKNEDYKFLPSLTDAIIKKKNWQNAAKAIAAIEKKIGLDIPTSIDFSMVRDGILFIVPTESIGKAFERAFSDYEYVEWTTSYSQDNIEKKLKKFKTVVIDDLPSGDGRDLANYLSRRGLRVIYMSATKEHYEGVDCEKIAFPPDLKELDRLLRVEK